MTGSNLPARPIDTALRRLSRSANKGRLWLGLAAAGALVPGPTRRAAIRGAGSLALTSALVNVVLKPLTRRGRPDIDLTPIVRRLHLPPRTTSFPSGHAASAAAFATGVALERPAIGAALAPLAAAVGYSRVHVGVHHVSDVVAGAAVGAGIAAATQRWWPIRPDEPARARENVHAPALPDGHGLVVITNPAAGNGEDHGPRIRSRLPGAELIELDDGLDLGAELDRRTARARVRAFGVAGGDGTVAAVAAAALRHDLPLVVFPAGTLNHFARDVGIGSFDDAFAALEAGEAVAVDVAEVNGGPFLNTSSIGAYPQMVRRRDDLAPRLGKWLATAVATSELLRRHKPIRLTLDGRPAEVWILFVGNGRYTPRAPFPAWRPRLDDGLLDIQYLQAGVAFARTRAVLATLAGMAERSEVYHTRVASSLRVESADGEVELARDGEPGERAASFQFGKLPGRLVVYRKYVG